MKGSDVLNYYISDLHFGHTNIIRFDGRPFSSAQEMENVLIENWNRVVTKSDTVYILGDFCWNKEPEWIRILDKLNGSKVLISGNHDLKNMSSQLRRRFADVKDYKEITDNGKRIVMCHYPIMMYRSSYNPDVYMLHGHTHQTKEQTYVEEWTEELRRNIKYNYDNRGQIINVGCMMPYMNYTPRTFQELLSNTFNKS